LQERVRKRIRQNILFAQHLSYSPPSQNLLLPVTLRTLRKPLRHRIAVPCKKRVKLVTKFVRHKFFDGVPVGNNPKSQRGQKVTNLLRLNPFRS